MPWLAAAQPTNYTIQVQPGFNSIANHLNRGNNSLDAVIPNPPPDSRLYKFNALTQSYYDAAEFIPGFGWFSADPNATFLRPGEGAFLQVNQSAVLNFSGDTASFTLPRQVVAGYNFVSPHAPRAMNFVELFGFSPLPGDRAYLFDDPFTGTLGAPQQNASSVHKFTVQGWDFVPTFKRGRSAFVFLGNGLRILIQPQPTQVVMAGQNVRFDVSAAGAGPLRYQWLFSEDELPGENNSFLIISNAQFWHSGLYSAVVSNASGMVTTRFASLRVNSRPVILEPPQGIQTSPGEHVAFHVRATGTPALRYQWSRNGTPILNATGPTLDLFQVSPQQAGQYSVHVTNQFGLVQSQAVPLTVNIPPTITQDPLPRTVRKGENVFFSVTAQGTQPLTYQWRRNGRNIPLATNATLVVSNVQPRQGGDYHVTVANIAGVAHSKLALLTVLEAEPIFLSDFFAAGPLRMEPFFTARGNNFDAKENEKDEPFHCERVGGSSVWLSWMTREPGIVTFDTSGSSFDTLMAAYIGNALPQLQPVACDDDEGEFYGSRIRFVARPDTIYHIAIDGVEGAKGQIIVEWDLRPTPDTLPVILRHPESQTARLGDSVTFFVDVDVKGDPPSFQWFHNGRPISGAREPFLTVQSVTNVHLGYYYVEIYQREEVVRSRRASLQISLSGVENNLLQAFAVDKFADAVVRQSGPAPTPLGMAPAGHATQMAMAFTPVLGYTGTQIFSTEGFEGEPGELSHCRIPGGSSAWFTYSPSVDGQFHLNTAGSTFNTVLGVYTGPGPTIASLTSFICDNDSGPGTTSSLNFAATRGTVYYIAVDGFNGVTGTAHLTYRLLVPMTLTNLLKTNDTLCRFRVTATPSYPFTIQRCVGFSGWVNVLTTNRPSGIFDYTDPAATVQKRFYRAFQIP